jgi:hypothetical protein
MALIQVEAEVGADGVLHLTVPLGRGEAERRVIVTIEPFDRKSGMEPADDLYGSCAGLGLEEPPDLPLPPAVLLE